MQALTFISISLYLIVVLFVFCVICDSNSTNKTEQVDNTIESTKQNNECSKLPPIILADLLGEAYNTRYMSINWPIYNDEVYSAHTKLERESYANTRKGSNYQKRKTDEQQSFYVDEYYAAEVSSKPAWDVKHTVYDELKKKRRRRRAIQTISIVNTITDNQNVPSNSDEKPSGNGIRYSKNAVLNRERRAVGRSSATDSFDKKNYPWKCDSYLRWVDLGPDFFPRYLRTVECVKHFCWYKAFICKPKSFGIKVLKRRKGICADTTNLKKLITHEFGSNTGEMWQWEEIAINFCCDCALA